MLKIIQKRLPINLTDEEASNIQQGLQTRYNSLLYRIRLEYLSRLGLDIDSYNLTVPSETSDLSIGELFMPQPGTVLYIKCSRSEGMLEAGVITDDDGYDSEGFFCDVREIIGEFRQGVAPWIVPEGFELPAIEDAEPAGSPVPPKQIDAARTIMDKQSRKLLAKIQEVGSIFLNKLETEDREDTASRIHKLEELELLNLDYAVLCRRTGQQILRAPDRATIDSLSQKDFKCFICGSQIPNEIIEETLTCTDLCEDLLKNQKWFVVLIRGILADMGIPTESVLIYNNEKSPIQLFLSLNGQRYMLVLCTEALTLDQAYLLGAHISAYSLDHAVIISTEKTTTLMRHHLIKSNESVSFHFIDDLDSLESQIKYTLLQQQRAYLRQQLEALSEMTAVCIPQLVLHRLVPEPKMPEPPVAEDIPAPEPPRKKAEPKTEEMPKIQEPAQDIPAPEAPEPAPAIEEPAPEEPAKEAEPAHEHSEKKKKGSKK
ncbi:MAG: hypothetical protein K6G50_07955 [bacterium]|nr:hypothetical protein [bacterium]